jgi:O-acetylhomoserine/O-acetylserine sulfhydrylase-like pyridoxal-dependent enzyme
VTSPRRPERFSTRTVHLPDPPVPQQRPVGTPVYRTSTYEFESMTDYADVLGGRADGYVYSRIDNPTADAFAAAVAALEGAEAAQPFASGMAAISTTLLALLSAGDHVVAQPALYGGTWSVLTSVLPRYGIETTFVDPRVPGAFADAIRPETRLLYAETLANPTIDVADLPGLASVARDAGVPLVVDSTFASPVVCRPLEHGADLVVHSATKWLGGHSDATGGVVAGRADLVASVRALRAELGGALAPDEAFLLRRGLATLAVRVERSSASALVLAQALREHPAVAAVAYPGLPTHPDHDRAQRLLLAGDDGRPLFGGVLMLTPHGDRDAGVAVCDALGLVGVTTSLGGVHSVVSHVASTTHRQLGDAALAAAGIGPASIRLSVGLEHPDDLLADLTQALDRL